MREQAEQLRRTTAGAVRASWAVEWWKSVAFSTAVGIFLGFVGAFGTNTYAFLPRMLVNSSMHACLLVRLLQGTPMWMTWFWRRLLITLHASDFQPYCRIGPAGSGLRPR